MAHKHMRSPMNKPYRITSLFGWRILAGKKDLHNGFDLVPLDKIHPVDLFATVDGVIDDVRSTVPDTHTGLHVKDRVTGNYVNIRTKDGWLVIYRHLKANSIPANIQKGSSVRMGDKVGVMGTTGQSSDVHLHFEVRNPKNEAIDPKLLIKESLTQSATPVADVSLAVKHAAEIIFANEGNYGSINKNDNGAVSVGKVQWHGPRALSLLKDVVKANPIQAQNILGELYTEIVNAGAKAWDKRPVNDVEAGKLSAILTTKEGKATQDALAVADITTYINKGVSYGLTDTGALIYFADGVNQYGTNSPLWKQIAETALKSTGDAAAMLNATKLLTPNYHGRREKVHRAISALNLVGATSQSPPGPVKPPQQSGAVFNVGDKVRILSSAGNYATTTTPIPDKYKNIAYTVQQVLPDRVLIQELYSWVWKVDLQKS